ncbi:hypothetical protein [Robbsia sp. KACC 23696]|uniref:hypothetical protein n=1 Tax=Robbsia sp. KACC 23696 TaxID=3149231 RepID=UPI00325ACB26
MSDIERAGHLDRVIVSFKTADTEKYVALSLHCSVSSETENGMFDPDNQRVAVQLQGCELHYDALPTQLAFMKAVFEKTIESVKEIQQRPSEKRTAGQLIQHIAVTLADKCEAEGENPSIDQGWQALLESGLRTKTALLQSSEFKTVLQASALCGVKEAAIRKRIREKKLFALKNPVDGEYRIPAWALDAQIAGATTADWLATAETADDWAVYAFFAAPNGSLNGLRPFECLLSTEHLPLARRALREDLRRYLTLPDETSLLAVVKKALHADLSEGKGI